MKFQDSKPEIEAPESKTYILPNFGMKFQDCKREIQAPESKTCKMYVYRILK